MPVSHHRLQGNLLFVLLVICIIAGTTTRADEPPVHRLASAYQGQIITQIPSEQTSYSQPVRTSSPPRVVVLLTLDQCIATALRNQPAIHAKRLAAATAIQKQAIARSFMLPQITFNGRYTNLDEPRTAEPLSLNGLAGDTLADAGAFFQVARQANSTGLPGHDVAAAALNNPSMPIPGSGQTYNAVRGGARNSLPDLLRTGVLGENSFTSNLLVVQPVWTGGKLMNRFKQANIQAHIAEQDASRSEQQTVFQVKCAYLQAQLASELLQNVDDVSRRLYLYELILIEKLSPAEVNEVDNGERQSVSRVDLLRLQAIRQSIEAVKVGLKQARDVAVAKLQNAMGLSQNAEIDIAQPQLAFGSYSTKSNVPIIDLALMHRPEMRQAQFASRLAALEVRRAKAQYAPDVAIFGRFSTIHDDRKFPNPNDSEEWAMGVNFDMPIFTSGSRLARVRAAELDYQRTRQFEELIKNQIAREARIAQIQRQQAKEAVTQLEVAVKKAEELTSALRNRHNARMVRDYAKHVEDRGFAYLLLFQARSRYNFSVYEHEKAAALINFVTSSNEYRQIITD